MAGATVVAALSKATGTLASLSHIAFSFRWPKIIQTLVSRALGEWYV